MNVTFTDNSAEVIEAKNAAIARALEAMGLQAEGYAKMLAPVDTGRLRNSLTHDARPGEEAVYIGTNVEYAPYVEYGTRRSRAQPYLEPAIQNHLGEYERIAKSFLKGE